MERAPPDMRSATALATFAGRPIASGGGADRQQFGACGGVVLVDIEGGEQSAESRLQLGERDPIVAVAVDSEGAGQRVAIAEPFQRPVAIVDIADRSLMAGIDRIEA